MAEVEANAAEPVAAAEPEPEAKPGLTAEPEPEAKPGLTKAQMEKLKAAFDKIDTDGSGQLDAEVGRLQPASCGAAELTGVYFARHRS